MQQNNSLTLPKAPSRQPRAKRSQADWQKLILECNNSPLSQQTFCQQHQVPLSSFYKWRKYFKQTGAADDFVEITETLASSQSTPVLKDEINSLMQVELELGRGIVLRVRCS